MSPVHGVAIAAALALVGGLTSLDVAHAQRLLQMSPPADGQVGKPKLEDIKLQTGTALPPKTGTLFTLSGGPMRPRMFAIVDRTPQAGAHRAARTLTAQRGPLRAQFNPKELTVSKPVPWQK